MTEGSRFNKPIKQVKEVMASQSTKKTSSDKSPVDFGYPAGSVTILFIGVNKTGKKAGGGRLMFKDAKGVTKVYLPRLKTQPDRVILGLVDSLEIPKGGLPATVNWADGEIEIVIDQ